MSAAEEWVFLKSAGFPVWLATPGDQALSVNRVLGVPHNVAAQGRSEAETATGRAYTDRRILSDRGVERSYKSRS